MLGSPDENDHEGDVAPSSPPLCWWTDLAQEISSRPGGTGSSSSTVKNKNIDSFSWYCHGKFFDNELSHAQYFECGSLIWMVKILDSGLCTAQQLQQATSKVMRTMMIQTDDHRVHDEEKGMASWFLPRWQTEEILADLPLELTGDDPLPEDHDEETAERLEEASIQWILRFWKCAFETVAVTAGTHLPNDPGRPSKKRLRTTYQYSSTGQSNNPLDALMKGSYKLPLAILGILISLELLEYRHQTQQQQQQQHEKWDLITQQAYGLQKAWRTLTSEDIRASLTVVGLQSLLQGRHVSGLTPLVLLEYLTRSGESTLAVLKNALQIDYYPLRATICEHLLEPVYSTPVPTVDDTGRVADAASFGGSHSDHAFSSDEKETQKIIRVINDFINREHPHRFLMQMQTDDATTTTTTTTSSSSDDFSPSGSNKKRKRTTATTLAATNVPTHITSPRFPLMTHLAVWLLQDNIHRAMELVKQMEQAPHVDGLWKDEAYLIVWNHLLRHGQLFLDGNGTHTASYIERRELLYNTIVSGMGSYGRGSMIDFYQTLAKTIWDRPQATLEEKHYVLVACQQTLLRLCIKCRGLGRSTIVQFLRETTWPVACQEIISLTHATTPNVEDWWALEFLRHSNPIPESLMTVEGGLDLSPLVDEPPPSSTTPGTSAELTVSPAIIPAQSAPPDLVQAVIPPVPLISVAEQQPTHVSEETNAGAYLPEESDLKPRRGDEGQEEEDDDNDDDVDADAFYDEEEPDVADAPREHNGLGPSAEQDDIIELLDDDDDDDDDDAGSEVEDDDDDASSEDDDDDGDGDGKDMKEQDKLSNIASEQGFESSDATVEMSDEDHDGKEKSVRRFADSREAVEYHSEDGNSQGSHEEEYHTEDEDPSHERREYSSSSDSERDDVEEESSDGVDDDDDDDVDQEAVVIRDSESEAMESDGALNDDMIRNQARDHYGEDGANFGGQFADADNGSDIQGEESDGGRPHRIAQGVVHDDSYDESDGDGMEEPGDEVNRVESQGSSDEDEHAPGQLARNLADHQEAIEVIDDESEGDVVEQARLASVSREPETPDSGIRRSNVYESSGSDRDEAAGIMASMSKAAENEVDQEDEEKATETRALVEPRPKPKVAAGNDQTAAEDIGDKKMTPDKDDVELESTSSGAAEAAYEHTLQEEDCRSTGDQAQEGGNVDSAATDDEEERAGPDEKADTEDAAAGGEFGDTTEEENDQAASSRANKLADADRRADVLRSRSGYASQLEDGYEPEDTHGYTEEEVSEAIHTEDEEEERAAAQESKTEINRARLEALESIHQILPHSSDDMDAADEHTEHEEDLGAESSELEENAEPKQYPYSLFSEQERDPTTLLEFAQSAQRLHQYGAGAPSDSKGPEATTRASRGNDDSIGWAEGPSIGDNCMKAKVAASVARKAEAAETSDNFASVEDEKEAESTIATETLEMTEDTVDHVDSDLPGIAGAKTDDPTDIDAPEIYVEGAVGIGFASHTAGALEEMAVDAEDGKDVINVNPMDTDTHPGADEEMDLDENTNKAYDETMIDAEDVVEDVAMEPVMADIVLLPNRDENITDFARTDKASEGTSGLDAPTETPPIEETEEMAGVASDHYTDLDHEERSFNDEVAKQKETDDETEFDDAMRAGEGGQPEKTGSVNEVHGYAETPPFEETEEKSGVASNHSTDLDHEERSFSDEVAKQKETDDEAEFDDAMRAGEGGQPEKTGSVNEAHGYANASTRRGTHQNDAYGLDAPTETPPIEETEEKTGVASDHFEDLDHDERSFSDEVAKQKETDDETEFDDTMRAGEGGQPEKTGSVNEANANAPTRRGTHQNDASPPREDLEETQVSASSERRTRSSARGKAANQDHEVVGESSRRTRRAARSTSKKADGGHNISASREHDDEENQSLASSSRRTRAQNRRSDVNSMGNTTPSMRSTRTRGKTGDADGESVGSRLSDVNSMANTSPSMRSTRTRGKTADADGESVGSRTNSTRGRAKLSVGAATTDANDQSTASSTRRSTRGQYNKSKDDESTPRGSLGSETVTGGGDESIMIEQGEERSVDSIARRSQRGRAKRTNSGIASDESSVGSTARSTGGRGKDEVTFDDEESVVSAPKRRSTRGANRKETLEHEEETEDVPLGSTASRRSSRRKAPPATGKESDEGAPKRTSRTLSDKKAGLPPLPPPRRSARKK